MRRAPFLLLLFLVPNLGCSRTPPPQAPAKGRVLVNGYPMRGGTVVFTPDAKRGARGPISMAVLDNNGAFQLASDAGPGAVVGWHRVTVAPPPSSPDLMAGLERYRHPDLSNLQFEIRTNADNEFTIALEWEP